MKKIHLLVLMIMPITFLDIFAASIDFNQELASAATVVSEHFSERAQVEQYAHNSALQWDAAMKIFQLFRFKGNEKVIDFGCGDGKITEYLSRNMTRNKVLGVDISPKMIESASSQYKNERLDFIIGDMTDFSTESKYDVAYAGYSIHYGDARKALSCMFESLEPGGSVLITLPGKYENSLASYSDRLAQSSRWKDAFVGFVSKRVYYTPSEFSELLTECGFIPDHVEAILQEVVFENQAAIEDFYLPVSAHAKHLLETSRKEFISDLVSMVLRENGSQTGKKTFVYQNKLEVIAHKR